MLERLGELAVDHDADPIGVDPVVFRVVTNEADGAVHVLDDLGDRELGLAAVHHGEDGVSAFDERVDEIVATLPLENSP